ncbi:MAG: hypothetical protein ACYSYU_01290 [Planctomycetota bacterium]|jgi:hypothetical protein
MNPIRKKMVSVLSEAVRAQIKSLPQQSLLANKIDEIEDIEALIADEALRMCEAASMGEITKIFLLVNKFEKVNEHEKEKITAQLNSIAEKLIKRVEDKTGPLKLSGVCLEMFSQL